MQGKPQIVIVPVDFEVPSREAVDVGLELAGAPEKVHVVHVLPDYTSGEPGMLWNVLNEATRRDRTEQLLRDRLDAERHRGVRIAILFGNPGREIAAFAQQCRAELIVVPSHRRRGVSRAVLGSVAERLIRLASCPVLVLKSPPDHESREQAAGEQAAER